MLPKSKRVLAIFFLAVIATLFWCLHFSYREGCLLSAIPGRAVFVSEHDALGTRWEELVQGAAGQTVARLDGIASAEPYLEYSRIARLLMNKKAVSAFVSGYAPSVKGRWVASCWLGSRSQLFRWGIVRLLVRGTTSGHLSDRTPYWICRNRGKTVIFAVRGGVLIAVCGDDKDLLQDMLRNLDSSVGGSPNINLKRLAEARKAFPDRKDVAWLQVPLSVSGDGNALLALDQQDDGVVLDAALSMQLESGGSLSDSAGNVSLVAGALVDAIAVGKWNTLKGFLGDAKGNPVLGFLNDVSGDSADAFIGVMSEEFSGKIYNIKVPVLLAGISVKPDIDVTKRVYDLMDKLNAEKGLGIIPVKMPTDTEYPVIVAGGSKMNLFGGIKERPALTVRDGWLVLCSDMESLLGLMLTNSGSIATEPPRWAALMAKRDGVAGVYMDSIASEQAIRNAIAVYTLSLIADGEATAEKRGQLDALRAMVEGLADVGEVSAVVRPDGDRLRISVLLGSEDEL